MPFGSIFSRLECFEGVTADGHKISIKNNQITRIAFKILGIPHIGMRLRARKIIKNTPDKKIESMLDAGCGTGVYSFSFVNKVTRIEGIDISSEKIALANKVNIFNNLKFNKGDLTKLHFKDSCFDFIVCSDVLEHIKEDKKAFGEIARVLKKNGTLLITVPYDSAQNRKTYKLYEHERPGYKVKDIKELCDKNGLTLVKSEGYSYPFADILSNISYKFTNSKIMLGLIFYPFLILSFLSDSFTKHKEPNGIFFKIIKM